MNQRPILVIDFDPQCAIAHALMARKYEVVQLNSVDDALLMIPEVRSEFLIVVNHCLPDFNSKRVYMALLCGDGNERRARRVIAVCLGDDALETSLVAQFGVRVVADLAHLAEAVEERAA